MSTETVAALAKMVRTDWRVCWPGRASAGGIGAPLLDADDNEVGDASPAEQPEPVAKLRYGGGHAEGDEQELENAGAAGGQGGQHALAGAACARLFDTISATFGPGISISAVTARKKAGSRCGSGISSSLEGCD